MGTGIGMMELLAQAEDVELIRLTASGSEPAFEELVRRYQDQIFGYFCHCGVGRLDAEDLAQEVFMKIYRNANSYRPAARFSTYLYAIARNCWIDFIRRRHRRPQTVALNEELHAERLEEERCAQSDELERNFREALDSLPDKQREALLLSEAQGLRYTEIAEVLEVPLGTVKSRIFSAVKMLREGMQRRGFRIGVAQQGSQSEAGIKDMQ